MVVSQRVVKIHGPEELRCAVLGEPQGAAEWEQYR